MKQTIIIIAVLLTATGMFAQQKDPLQKTRTTAVISDQDHQFIITALQGGNAEIQKGKLAAGKSTNQEIIKYGEMMQQDHSSVNRKLEQLAQQKNINIPDKLDDNAQKMLDKLRTMEGDAFDKEFTAQMITDHKKTIELFKQQTANGTDPALKETALKALPTLEKHLMHIEQLQSKDNIKTK